MRENFSPRTRIIAEYNLLALSVVDDLGEIADIVAVDDAMENTASEKFK